MILEKRNSTTGELEDTFESRPVIYRRIARFNTFLASESVAEVLACGGKVHTSFSYFVRQGDN